MLAQRNWMLSPHRHERLAEDLCFLCTSLNVNRFRSCFLTLGVAIRTLGTAPRSDEPHMYLCPLELVVTYVGQVSIRENRL